MEGRIRIKELRLAVPIPISEGIKLLKENDNNVDKCISIFIKNSIDKIVQITNCEKSIAETKFREEKFDINVAISIINRDMYDANYQSIEGLSKSDLLKAREWFNIVQMDGFYVSMTYTNVEDVIKVLNLIPNLKDVATIIQNAYTVYGRIFEGYSDCDPIEEFVRRNKRLDDSLEFNENMVLFKTKTIKLNEELSNHIRNTR